MRSDDRGAPKLVEPYLGDDQVFMATYGDGLTDVPSRVSCATFEAVGERSRSSRSYGPHYNAHIVEADPDGTVRDITPMTYPAFGSTGASSYSARVLDWIEPGEELVEETSPS